MALSAPHIVVVPKAFFVLRIIQIALAVCLLGLLAYLTYVYDSLVLSSIPNYIIGGFGVGLFSCCLTFILGAYYLITSQCAPGGYNFWALISLESLATLFWLVTFALLANTTAAVSTVYDYQSSSSGSYYYDYSDYYDYYKLARRSTHSFAKRASVDPWSAILYAALALSVVEWILFVASLIVFSIAVHKHRKSNMPMNADGAVSEHYTPKQMEAQAQPMPDQGMPAPTYQQPVGGYAQQGPMH